MIAAINGTAVGIGITMVLPMDVRIAAEGARFGLPFSRRGIVPESCASWFLPRVVGIANAVDWAVSGRIFTAEEALAAGLVRELVPASGVLARAQEVAADIAANTSAVSVVLTRQMLWRQLGRPTHYAPTNWSHRHCWHSVRWVMRQRRRSVQGEAAGQLPAAGTAGPAGFLSLVG